MTIAINPIKYVQIALTYDCQCSCEHCGVSILRKSIKNEMSHQMLKRIFYELKILGCDTVDLFGGEPTLRKDIFDIIKLGKSHGFRIFLETNGININMNAMKKLKESGLDLIYLSFDDYEEKNYDSARKYPGLFANSVNVMEYARTVNIPLITSFVPKNMEYFRSGRINSYIEFCKSKGVKNIRLLFPRLVGNSLKNNKTEFIDGKEIVATNYIDRKYYDYVFLDAPDSPCDKTEKCTSKKVLRHIMANGFVSTCPYVPFVFGDCKTQSLYDIFEKITNHPLYKEFGDICPTRSSIFIEKYMKQINPDKPFEIIYSENLVRLGDVCNNKCSFCDIKKVNKNKDIADVIAKLDNKYETIEVFGGQVLLEEESQRNIEVLSKKFRINLSTNGRIFAEEKYVNELRNLNISKIKAVLFSTNRGKYQEICRSDGFIESLKGIENLSKTFDVTTYIYNKGINSREELSNILEILIRAGTKAILTFDIINERESGIHDFCLCTGNIKKTKLLWARKDEKSSIQI